MSSPRRGRSISVYLVDGTASGLVLAEVRTSRLLVIVARRTQMPALLARPEASRTGVYLLLGPDTTDAGETVARDRVYVGECNVFNRRLPDHVKSDRMEFWDRVVAITTIDDCLTKTEGLYLESCLLKRIRETTRAAVHNHEKPLPPQLSEAAENDMQEYLDQIADVLAVLGIDVLEPEASRELPNSSPIFSYRLVKDDLTARAVERGGDFVLLKDSHICRQPVQSCSDRVKAERELLLNEGVLQEDEIASDRLVLTRDYRCASPSAASCIVYGGPTNGRRDWKIEATGQSYGDWQDAQVSAVEETE